MSELTAGCYLTRSEILCMQDPCDGLHEGSKVCFLSHEYDFHDTAEMRSYDVFPYPYNPYAPYTYCRHELHWSTFYLRGDYQRVAYCEEVDMLFMTTILTPLEFEGRRHEFFNRTQPRA